MLPVLFFTPVSYAAQAANAPSEFALFEEVPMVFSASKIEEPLIEAPAAISVISGEDLHDWGILDLPDAFRYVPGVDVVAFSGREWGVSPRGMNERFARRTLVQIDGMSVYTPMLSGVEWATLPLLAEDIDSIEVIRGPNDTLYGFNAFNGVINIKTKKPEDAQGLFGRYVYGTNDRSQYTGRYGDSVRFNDTQKLDFYTSYSHLESQGYGDNRGAIYEDGRWPHLAHLKGIYTINENLSFDSSFGINTGPQQQGALTASSPIGHINYINFFYTLNKLNFKNGENSRGYLQFYHWRRLIDAKSMTAGLSADDSDEKQYDIELQNQWDLLDGRSSTVAGGNFRVTGVKSLFVRPVIPEHASQNTYDSLYSVFFNEKFILLKDRPLIKKLTAVAGLRMEGTQLIEGPRWAPRASLLYEPISNNVFRATYARAYRLPSFFEEFNFIPNPVNTDGTLASGTGALFQGNRDVKEETVDSYELGYSGSYLKNKLTLDVDTFIADYKGLTQIVPIQQNTVPLISSINSSLHAYSYGVELAGAWRVKPWLKLFSNYTYERIVNTNHSSINKSYEDSTPYNKVSAGANFKFREGSNAGMDFLNGWMFNFLVNYRDAYNIYDENAFAVSTFGIKPNIRFDIHIAKSFFDEGLEVGFIAQNLTSSQHFESSFVQVPQLFFLTVTVRDWPWDFWKPQEERMGGFIQEHQSNRKP